METYTNSLITTASLGRVVEDLELLKILLKVPVFQFGVFNCILNSINAFSGRSM